MCRHSFPGAPVPRDLHWNSGACVSWHSMARLQSCTEVVSCTALSALCSACSGAGSKPNLRLCRPPLVVARDEERAQPPAEDPSHSVLHFSGSPRSPPAAVLPGAAGFPKVRAASPVHSRITHAMTAPALFFIRMRKHYPIPWRSCPFLVQSQWDPEKLRSVFSGDNSCHLPSFISGGEAVKVDVTSLPKLGRMARSCLGCGGTHGPLWDFLYPKPPCLDIMAHISAGFWVVKCNYSLAVIDSMEGCANGP